MTRRLELDICVIGAGSAGLSLAAGAAQLGLKVALIEHHKMGGDCLNYGCVPSKALIAAAQVAQTLRQADRFGVGAAEPAVDFAAAMDHVHAVIAAIAPHDSVERFEGLGVQVIQAPARFVSRDEVMAGEIAIRARRFVVATGSRPVAPPIPGLADVPYLTNETLFSNRARPDHLLVIGGGPVGLEMAQAHRRLGARVTVLEAARLMGSDDPELVDVVRRRLASEGVELHEQARILRVERDGMEVAVAIDTGSGERRLAGSHLLIAAGRAPNVEQLDLATAGIAATPKGITVDKTLRTTNRRVYAVGDVNGLAPFTHMAGAQAALVIRHALFRLPIDVHAGPVPRCTYTDPELAQVGMTEAQARAAHGDTVRVVRWPLTGNDRAQAERETEGLVKVVTDRRGRVLGAGIVGARAGELIQVWCLALARRLKIGAVAQMVVPYPTLGEINKRAAGAYFTERLFSPRTRRVVGWLFRLW
ncbi:dihydrolipoyl dehydrogenase family protein [Vineibacter terrae]|uniref:dihydrolipoyl dehydrogenase family protein n=1 Tax=Vineibacter terrae TaxID=2586908 RepID=UPI002E315DDD|nr:FAD-dependent oxidoreductase [Vineibacter terrae]HEX2892168.1 FAD-dependent oxidoreductase [Vineibacter terrae]